VGTVTAAPDIVTVALGVQTRDATASAALEANNARTRALLDVLAEAGVAAEDRRTSGLAVHPTYAEGGRITGYEVTNRVTATLRDIGRAGAVIDAAAAAAGDAIRVEGITFDIADDSAARAEARAAAVREALDRAAQLAEAAGVALGPIRSITELPAEQPPVPYALEAAQADVASVPIEPGVQELTVTVEVVHDLAG
uniref:SIMPL domain-containing protein n=1 Tax=Pseudonocardia nigra TaxID=1921578 RepID=UPI001C5D23C4